MRKRLAAILGGVVLLLAGVYVGVAMATTTDLDSSSIDFKQVSTTYADPSSGSQLFKAQCPAGYKPVGGGGFVTDGFNGVRNVQATFPYDDGNLGWAVRYDTPGTGWTVIAYAVCMNIT